MRCAEFTTSSTSSYDSRANLLVGDVAVDSYHEPTAVAITIKMSKMDQFSTGVTIYLGRANNELCPVTALLNYLAIRPTRDGPLFGMEDGRFLSKDLLRVCQALSNQGVDSSLCRGHSFRVGVATTAAACGIEDSLIKILGRWSSSTYQRYIRVSASDLV